MTAYSLVLMVLCSLQVTTPPVLPVLTVMEVAGRDAFAVSPHPLQWKSYNVDSLGWLFSSFFELYATRFNAATLVVSPRAGLLLTRGTGPGAGWHATSDLCVEDPLSPLLNASSGVSFEALCFVEKELQRAHGLLEKGDGATVVGVFELVCGLPVPVAGADTATTVMQLLLCLLRLGDAVGQSLRFLANAVRCRPDLTVSLAGVHSMRTGCLGDPDVSMTLGKLCGLQKGLVSVEGGRRVVLAELEAHELRRPSSLSIPDKDKVLFSKRLPLAGNPLNQVWMLQSL
jgi:hypothetical protein